MAPSGDQSTNGLLDRTVAGDAAAADDLFKLVYDELRGIAHRLLKGDGRRLTLQPTAIVHEAYLKLIGAASLDWNSRTHFRAIAARAMHQVVANHLRDGNRVKRGRDWRRVTLSELDGVELMAAVDLDDALRRLVQVDEQAATIVVLEFFGGMSDREVANHLGLTEQVVRKDWRRARAWLRADLLDGSSRA